MGNKQSKKLNVPIISYNGAMKGPGMGFFLTWIRDILSKEQYLS